MIIVKNRELLIPRNEQYIGTPNDNNADNRVFRISRLSQTGEDLSGLTYRLDLLYPDKRNVYTVSALTSRSGRSVVVLTTLFARQYPAAGTYTFSFDGTNWKYNNQNVTLSEVGIIIAYNPVSGDTVTVTSTIQQVITDTVLLSKEITDEYINLTWTVTAAQLAIPGTVYVTLRGANDDAEVRWASFQGAFYVEQNNYTPAMFTGPMSELEYFEQVLSSNLVKLEYLPTKYEELEDAVEDAEAWAKGTRSGSEVPEGDDTYHNNSKYYSEQANASKNAAAASQSAAAASQNAAAASASQAAQIVPDLINAINTETNRAKAAENTLQQSISTETAARAATDSSLQSQINQYVKPSTQQPDEVVNARVGADGTTYSTLGDAIRGQITDLKSAFDEDRSKIFAETCNIYKSEIAVTQNKAIDASTKQITVDIASGDEYTVLFTDPDGCFTETISFYAFKEDDTRVWVGSAQSNTALTKTAGYNIKGFSIYYQKPAATGTVEMEVISNVEEHPNSIEAKVNALAENRVLYKNASVALSGSGQFVTKDIDVPVDETGVYYNVTVGSVENVSPAKPVRFRFLDSAGTVIAPDSYIAVGVVGTLVSPSNAAKLRLTLYATTSGGLIGNAYFKDVAIWVGNPADKNIDLVVSEDIFAQRLTVEGHAFLPDNPLIPSFAHKGYALTAPECTGAAMVEAKRRGFTGVENDTQLTSDGQIVMWHDNKLSKIGDSSHGVGDYTLAQLKAMDFGSWKASKYANERILTFAEWVLLCKNLGLKINVDTKFEWTAEQAASLAQTVIDYGMTDNCVWNINFNGGYTTKLVELIPKANLNYIGTATAERCAILQSFMSEHPNISVQLTPELSELTAADVARAHSFGIKQFFYTAIDLTTVNLENYKTYMQSALTFGVDGGVTDIYRIADIANMELL